MILKEKEEKKSALPLLGLELRTFQAVANLCKDGFIYTQYSELVCRSQ